MGGPPQRGLTYQTAMRGPTVSCNTLRLSCGSLRWSTEWMAKAPVLPRTTWPSRRASVSWQISLPRSIAESSKAVSLMGSTVFVDVPVDPRVAQLLTDKGRPELQELGRKRRLSYQCLVPSGGA